MTALATEPTTTEPAVSPTVMALAHVVRRDIIACLSQGITTPKEIALAKGHELGVVAYHARMLVDYGLIEVTRREPRRGALQHFYGFTVGARGELECARDLATTALRQVRRTVPVPVERPDAAGGVDLEARR